jgi:hypothetical protein
VPSVTDKEREEKKGEGKKGREGRKYVRGREGQTVCMVHGDG